MQKKETHTPTLPEVKKAVRKSPSKRKSAPDNRLTLAYQEYKGVSYHLPVGNKWVKSYFDKFYLTGGGMFIHTGKPERTLYAIEPMFKGHDASRFSLKCCIPAENYQLSQSYLLNPDCVLALYMDGYSEPLWVGRPSLSGSLTAVLPYEKYQYGNYFLHISNLRPNDACMKQFVRLGTGWRFDFEFMPNGINMEHPAFSDARIEQSGKLCLSFYKYTPTAYDRFTALFYDESLNFMGTASDVHPHPTGIDLPLPAGRAWTDGKYHVILQHNLYSFQLVTFVSENGYLQVESCERLPEDSPFFRLSVDVNGNEVILNQWTKMYGCGPIKHKLLDFTATHDMDDYQDFAIIGCPDYVPHPKTLASLLYAPQLYVDYHAEVITEERLSTPTSTIEKILPPKGLAVIGIHHIGILSKSQGKQALKELEGLCSRPNTYFLVCGTPEEIKRMYSASNVLRNRLTTSNVWKANNPVLQDYMRMSEYILQTEKRKMTSAALRKLGKQVKEKMDEKGIIGKRELVSFLSELAKPTE